MAANLCFKGAKLSYVPANSVPSLTLCTRLLITYSNHELMKACSKDIYYSIGLSVEEYSECVHVIKRNCKQLDFKVKCLQYHKKSCMLNLDFVKTYKSISRLLKSNVYMLNGLVCRQLFHSSSHHHSVFDKLHGDTVFTKKEPPWCVKFFGTDEIALATLKELHKNMTTTKTVVEKLDVVTIKDKTPRAVKQYALQEGLQLEEWPILIENNRYDVGVLVSFGHLIPDNVIHMFPYGILNMHPSLLPRWRGASPVIHTILNGDQVTGVSIMEIRPKHFDVGPILMQRQFMVPYRCTALQLADQLSHFGATMMLDCLKNLPTLERFEHEQEKSGITYAHKIQHKNANIDWCHQSALEIDSQYRAIHSIFPLKTELNGHVVKLFDVVDPYSLRDVTHVKGYSADINSSMPGTTGYSPLHECIIVKCKTGLVGFKTVILKKTLDAKDFYNGYLNGRDHVIFTSLRNDLNKYTTRNRIPLQSQL